MAKGKGTKATEEGGVHVSDGGMGGPLLLQRHYFPWKKQSQHLRLFPCTFSAPTFSSLLQALNSAMVEQKKSQTRHKWMSMAVFQWNCMAIKIWVSCSFIVAVESLSRVWLCDPMVCSTPGFCVLHYLLEFAQTHVLWMGDALPLSPPSPFAFSLFQWVGSLHQVAKVLGLQLQHQSFQWIFSVYFL